MTELLDPLGYLISVIVGASITWIVSKKEQKFRETTAQNEREDKFKLFILENRIEVYQSAYSLCQKLIRHFNNKEELFNTIEECQKWWEKNCLFLSKKVRDHFYSAFSGCLEIEQFNSNDRRLDKESRQHSKEVWSQISRTKRVIEDELGLPKSELVDYYNKEKT